MNPTLASTRRIFASLSAAAVLAAAATANPSETIPESTPEASAFDDPGFPLEDPYYTPPQALNYSAF